MGESAKKHLEELLESFDTAMLITRSGEKVHARPMALQKVEGPSTLWFVGSDNSPKAEEIEQDSRVSCTFQGKMKFIALSGTARLVKDRAKIEELWKPDWKVWFPDGKDDPKIALLEVTVTDAEFWDNAGTKGIAYVFEAAKSLLKGEQPKPVAGAHARIKDEGAGPVSTSTAGKA